MKCPVSLCLLLLKTECYWCVLLVLMMPTNSNKPCLIWHRALVEAQCVQKFSLRCHSWAKCDPTPCPGSFTGFVCKLNQSRLMDECRDRVDLLLEVIEWKSHSIPVSICLSLVIVLVSLSGLFFQTLRWIWNLNLSFVSSFNASTFFF